MTKPALYGVVYKITHKATGRAYIGLTTLTPERRFRQHVYKALSRGQKSKLAEAIREFGPDAFTVETVARCRTADRLASVEQQTIRRLRTDVDGFNMHPGGNLGGQTGKAIIFKGVSYTTISALCRAYALDYYLFKKRRAKGWSLDECVVGRARVHGKAITVEYAGHTYASVKEFCEAHGHSYRNFCSRAYREGWDLNKNLAYVVAQAGNAFDVVHGF